jgi:hypothetical protein
MDAIVLGVVLFFEIGLKLIGAVAGAVAPTPGPPFEGPVVYEVRTATAEEISAAAAELPELLRRAEEAAARARQ